jgi:molecular chaperone DnaK
MGTAQEIPFLASKQKKKPEELSAEILKVLRRGIASQFGFEPVRAVVSVPALFELPQSAATSEAARLAGFTQVELIQEPVASALAAGWTADEPEGFWVVYDLGGGTFDVSLLETRDGLLRVVAHDGDNFLGGRDIDQAIVDWAARRLEAEHEIRLVRSDPAHATLLRRLKAAAEEAKIELTHSDVTQLLLTEVPGPGGAIDVELEMDRAILDSLALPLIDRSIAVCTRLLADHGVSNEALRRIVLVGGPTAMPTLRKRVKEKLGAPVAEGLDPMTLVAQGASIYALTSRLSARAAEDSADVRRQFWMQYPGMSSDLAPHVMGRLAGGGTGPVPVSLRMVRADGGWQGPSLALDADGTFVTPVELVPRKANVFRLEAFAKDGSPVSVEPAAVTIVHGLTLSDPPLSRTIGVALADDSVREFLRRGTPLPAKKTVTLRTVETVTARSDGAVVKIPIVQGEFPAAHLCRLVGSLEVSGKELTANLPAASAVDLTLEVDRGGRLSARAFVPAVNQLFSHVARLVVAEVDPESLAAGISDLKERLTDLRREAFSNRDRQLMETLKAIDGLLEEASSDLSGARGGDPDSAQRAQRNLLEADAALMKLEEDRSWPELWSEAQQDFGWAAQWVAQFGTDVEKRHLDEAGAALGKAHHNRQPTELARQLKLVSRLGTAAFYRHPEAWFWMFDTAASHVSESSDIARAAKLVEEGEKARQRGDSSAVRQAVEKLWALLPPDPEIRRLGYGSGIR